MTLGLSFRLAPHTVSRSFARGLHAAGFTCLAAAFLVTIAFQSANPSDLLWPAMIALLPMIVLLWLTARTHSTFYSTSFLIVGAACSYWFALTFSSQLPPILSSDAFSFALPKIALVMVGGSGAGVAARVAWCAAGYLAAEVSVGAALLQTGHSIPFDVTTFLAFAITVTIFALASLSRRRSRRTQPILLRAVRDEQLAAMRHRIEATAAALIHDTVLSHLAAIANSSGNALNRALQTEMERDLETLIGEEWLTDESPTVDSAARRDWEQSSLFAAIQESRALGLTVETTGDLSAVLRLERASSHALGLAVKQCLVNVLRHAGTDQAEVAVFGSDVEVSVMVIDAGRGFAEAETGADKLGLRQSVRRRIESVGGGVQVWSTPGRGTSIMIRVPAANPIDSPSAVGDPR